MSLTGKQKRHLRALGHHLATVVQVGSDGVTAGVISATRQALADHELVKVKIADDREGREQAIAALVEGTGAEVAQTLGRTVLFFLKRKKKSKFDNLFKPGGAAEVEVTRKRAAKKKPAGTAKRGRRNSTEAADDDGEGEEAAAKAEWFEEEEIDE